MLEAWHARGRHDRTEIAELLGWHATKSGDKHISLTEHVDPMKDGQNDNDYFAGKSSTAMSSSPFLKNLAQEGFSGDVHSGPIGEHRVRQLREFDG